VNHARCRPHDLDLVECAEGDREPGRGVNRDLRSERAGANIVLPGL
jgi:hypothetical protein